MSIDPKEIESGKCFVTAGEQVRRVIGTRGADVFYEVRSREPGVASWGPKKTVSIANFAATVEREVSCDAAPASAAAPEAPSLAPSVLLADPVLETRALIDLAIAAGTTPEKLAHLYAAADLLVQAIESMEQPS